MKHPGLPLSKNMKLLTSKLTPPPPPPPYHFTYFELSATEVADSIYKSGYCLISLKRLPLKSCQCITCIIINSPDPKGYKLLPSLGLTTTNSPTNKT